MKTHLAELYRYRALLYMFAYRDIKIKYKQSVMGVLWAVLMPLLVAMAGITVKYAYAILTGSQVHTADLVNVAVKSIPWAFLVASIRFSASSLISNNNLVTKIYFPKEVFPLSAVLSQLFDFAIASAALAVLLMLARTGLSTQLVWIPLLLAAMVILATAIAVVVSAASLFFRDVKYIVEVVLTFGIFFTPVLYDVSMFGGKAKLLLLNPAAPILEGFSACIAHHQAPDWPWLLYSLGFGLLTLAAGYSLFKKVEPAFAESI